MLTKERKYLDISDLALVLGCQSRYIVDGKEVGVPDALRASDLDQLNLTSKEIRFIPLLRTVKSLTEEEKIDFSHEMAGYSPTNILEQARGGVPFNWFTSKRNAEMIRWLLRKHVDVFGWIKAGLAEDINKNYKADNHG